MDTGGALGVGFVGAGSATQAIHLPALTRLPELFTVRVVMDVDPRTAEGVAARVGARPVTSVEDLLSDDAVDVVAVCSLHDFHAEQVIAACRAGKRAVLCEKPFATTREEAARIADVLAETGVPVVVGAMHTYDPGWLWFAEAWGPLPGAGRHIRCSAVLPPNARFEDFATEIAGRSSQEPSLAGSTPTPAELLRAGILGLAVHDLPLVRTLLKSADDVVVHTAEVLRPFGYLVVLSFGDQVVELHARMSSTWNPSWQLEVVADDRVGVVDFTPSYVFAGSATASIRSGDRLVGFDSVPFNGVEGEWRHLHAVAHGRTPRFTAADLIADVNLTIDLADKAAESLNAAANLAGAR